MYIYIYIYFFFFFGGGGLGVGFKSRCASAKRSGVWGLKGSFMEIRVLGLVV